MSVPQYTTPTFTLTFNEDGLDLTEAINVYVTFRSGAITRTKSGSDLEIETQAISVFMSQNDTSKFRTGDVEIQANWTEPNGGRAASEVVNYPISEQLLKRVVT